MPEEQPVRKRRRGEDRLPIDDSETSSAEDQISMPEDTDAAQERALAARRERRRRTGPADEVVPVVARVKVKVEPSDEIKMETEDDDDEAKDDDDDDLEFDMFASETPPPEDTTNNKITTTQTRGDCDDADGYYKAVAGETIAIHDHEFTVAGVVGKGVFSTVLKCSTTTDGAQQQFALKLIRHNESMAKAALVEIQALQQLSNSPGIVPLLYPTSPTPVQHLGHTVLVFPFLEHNLRQVLQKFGQGVGLSLASVINYFGQLVAAATHLERHGILHADIKPDNILVTADYSRVLLADFGSVIDPETPTTPYLVSRFYRAPEIILGLKPTTAIDLWSLAVTMVEIYVGKVLFDGHSNNDMLYGMMQRLGPLSNKVIRQHLVASQSAGRTPHFTRTSPNYQMIHATTDGVTGQAVVKHIPLNQFPSATPLAKVLRQARSETDRGLPQFTDLLTQCLHLDASKRIRLTDALAHPVFRVAAKQPANNSS